MAFDWYDYLSLSGDLLAGHQSVTTYHDACWRTVVSRSYYAVFQLALAHCNARGDALWRRITSESRNRDQVRGLHDQVIAWFQRSSAPAEIAIGRRLLALKDMRIVADYRCLSDCSRRQAEIAYREAQSLIQEIQSG